MTSARVAGVDEAGRGCLAGPVVAAAVILDPRDEIQGLADSKVLSALQRERLAEQIKARALCWAVASATVAEIDQINILRASLTAMARAIEALSPCATHALIDGNIAPPVRLRCTTVIGGDAIEPAISAASILAKTARDAMMCALDADFPGYGFAQHKGYCTEAHVAALHALGPLRGVHRQSFSPVRQLVFSF